MKVLLTWIAEFIPELSVDPTDLDAAEQLGETMSDLGMAVESMKAIGTGLDGIVVAKVLATRAHPDADRIQLVDVDAGDGAALQVCCGAFNMAPGDLVPLATIGAVMPNGIEIARRKMRGEWSNGMLCSATELGLGDDHSGIHIMEPGLELGIPVAEALGIVPDVLYDLEINPNRPDAMSVAGVARDLAARLGLAFRLPQPVVRESGPPVEDSASVEIVDGDRCGRFAARVLRGVAVAPSPPAIASRLSALGMRPINNIVDASNYVMLELGQPNHAYDLDRLGGSGLRVRLAREGEKLTTLDDVERALTADDLLICDADDQPVGIAGVMGGADSEISDQTKDVLLELAWFEAMPVAKTARRLGLRSEASARFEKGTDPMVLELAAARFVELLGAHSGDLAPGVIDARGDMPPAAEVALRTSRVNGLLGGDGLSADEIDRLLRALEFEVERENDEQAVVRVPTFRPDTETEVDVIEEIARLRGFNTFGKTVPNAGQIGRLSPHQAERRQVRQVLVGMGLCEAMPMPFLDPADTEKAGLPPVGIKLANPLVADESVLRTSLLPGLLKAVAFNQSHRNRQIHLFEIGTTFLPPLDGEPLPDEHEMVAIVRAEAEAPVAKIDFDVLHEALALPPATLHATEVPGLHPTRCGVIRVDGDVVGALGEVDPGVLREFGVSGRVSYVELDLGRLLAMPHGERPYREVSRYPSSDLDLAFVVDETTAAGEVEQTLRAAGGAELVSVSLFDVYRGDGLPPATRSLAYALRVQAADRTLTDDEIAAIRQRCIDAVEAEHPATLRG